MWRAWIGFNFSHSLGVLLLAAVAIWAGTRMRVVPVGIVAALTLIGCIYLVLALALLVPDSSYRRCLWYRLLRCCMDPVTKVTGAIR